MTTFSFLLTPVNSKISHVKLYLQTFQENYIYIYSLSCILSGTDIALVSECIEKRVFFNFKYFFNYLITKSFKTLL